MTTLRVYVNERAHPHVRLQIMSWLDCLSEYQISELACLDWEWGRLFQEGDDGKFTLEDMSRDWIIDNGGDPDWWNAIVTAEER